MSIVSFMRNGTLHLNPDAADCFTTGDWVAVIGTAEHITTFHDMVEPLPTEPLRGHGTGIAPSGF